MTELVDVFFQGIKDSVDWFTGLFMDGLRSGYETLSAEVLATPTPQADGAFIFGEPTNAPWPTIRDGLVGGEVMLSALLLLVISVQTRHTIQIFRIGNTYEAKKTKKTAWTGAILIVTWYWVGTLLLYLVDGFTVALMPSFSAVSAAMLEFLSKSITNPALGLLFDLLGGLSMWAVEALFYLRRVLLYIYLYGMPIAFALTYGNVPVVSDIAKEFSKRFVPLAVLPIPAAIVLKGYDILYTGQGLTPETAFLKYLVAASFPLVVLYVTWKTFRYAAPLTANVLGGATKSAAVLGLLTGGAYVGGTGVAMTAARWGPKAATGHAIAQKAAARGANSDESDTTSSYRRTENDPKNS